MTKGEIINIFYETLSTDNNVIIHGFVEAAEMVLALHDNKRHELTEAYKAGFMDADDHPFDKKMRCSTACAMWYLKKYAPTELPE